MSDNIPIVETYRGVGIHDHQPQERIQRVVKPAIDEVHASSDIDWLLAYCDNVTKPPEARLFAAAKCEAIFQIAVDQRKARPEVSIERIHASVAGLGSQNWRDRRYYASLFDACRFRPGSGGIQPDRRETPIPDPHMDAMIERWERERR